MRGCGVFWGLQPLWLRLGPSAPLRFPLLARASGPLGEPEGAALVRGAVAPRGGHGDSRALSRGASERWRAWPPGREKCLLLLPLLSPPSFSSLLLAHMRSHLTCIVWGGPKTAGSVRGCGVFLGPVAALDQAEVLLRFPGLGLRPPRAAVDN